MSTCKLKITDKRTGRYDSLTKVLAPVALTGVSTTSGSNTIVVADTSGVYVGMPVACANIPQGSFILAIKDATHLVLAKSAWDATTGTWSTSEANANAAATGSSLLAKALGFCPLTIVVNQHALGVWRNTFAFTGSQQAGITTQALTQTPYVFYPTAVDASLVATAWNIRHSDDVEATPLKRHEGQPWGCYIITHTDGHQTMVPANQYTSITFNGLDA